MLPSTYEAQQCSIARALEVVGERWTLLLIRDAFLGVRRFDDFQAHLGISRNILTRRIGGLVEAGLLYRKPYQERPTRYEYLPTPRALDLWPVILGLAQWGDEEPSAPPAGVRREFFHAECGNPIRAVAYCPDCGVGVAVRETCTAPGLAHRGPLASDVDAVRDLMSGR